MFSKTLPGLGTLIDLYRTNLGAEVFTGSAAGTRNNSICAVAPGFTNVAVCNMRFCVAHFQWSLQCNYFFQILAQ